MKNEIYDTKYSKPLTKKVTPPYPTPTPAPPFGLAHIHARTRSNKLAAHNDDNSSVGMEGSFGH